MEVGTIPQHLSDWVARARALTKALGHGVDAELELLDAFERGPLKVVILGSTASGKEALHPLIAAAVPGCLIEDHPLSGFSPRTLCDAIVLATPSFAALSGEELSTVARLRELKRPVAVIITRADKLGTGPSRLQAEEDIVTKRLVPCLDSLSVSWTFWAECEGSEALTPLLRPLHNAAAHNLHRRPGLDALADIATRSLATLETGHRERERDFGVLEELERDLPLMTARLSDCGRLAHLRVQDLLRMALQDVWLACLETADALGTWTERGGLGDPETATDRLRIAWKTLIDSLENAPVQAFQAYLDEAERMSDGLCKAADRMGLMVPRPIPPAPNWYREASESARGKLEVLSVELLLDAAVARCREQLVAPGPKASPSDQAGSAVLNADDRGGELEKWLKTFLHGIQTAARTPLAAELRLELVNSVDLLVSARFQEYLACVAADTEIFSAAAGETLAQQLHTFVETLRMELEQHYSWAGPAAELLAFSVELGRARRVP